MSLTMQQALEADEFHQTGPFGRNCATDRHGPVRWRRNGKTQTWARRPNDFSIPVKWGLKSYDRIEGSAIEPESTAFMHALADCPIEVAWAEAREHGHPGWSHLIAFGPCIQPTKFTGQLVGVGFKKKAG